MRRSGFLAAAGLPGFTRFVSFPKMTSLPVRSKTPDDFSFERQYQCGQFYGLITNRALTGPYRQQNNARARAAGYPIRKWPYVPLTGAIVRDLPHGVFEVYEGIAQFATARAARQYLALVQNNSGTRDIPDSRPGYAVYTAVLLGGSGAAEEHAIRVNAQVGDLVVSIGIQGGQDLAWTDVSRYWAAARRRLLTHSRP